MTTEEITTPTGEQLVARFMTEGRAMIGGRRDGTLLCQVTMLPDGYAYRQWGNKSDADWRWAGGEEFNRDFVTFDIINMQDVHTVISELSNIASKWRIRCRGLMDNMGKKSKRRLGKSIVNSMNQMD